MNFLIITHAEHYINAEGELFAYAPYVQEMNIWLKHVDEVTIIAPRANTFDSQISLNYTHPQINFVEVSAFSLLGFTNSLKTLLVLPGITYTILKAMKTADHIHLRCPGNMGLIGCFAQVLFPQKTKTAKYAGNWDPQAKQPWSYNLQKWILNNTFLTKNMKVLVYGNWPNQSKNIKPFFTASYLKSEIEELYIRNYKKTLHFCFVGTLSPGKQPLEALTLINQLKQNGIDAVLHFYGDGELKEELINRINHLNAENWAFVYGNQPKGKVKKALKYSHFLILLSQSEGWPKAVAEAKFWGCIPITSKVSCLTWMIDNGSRGFLLSAKPGQKEIDNLMNALQNSKELEQMSKEAYLWSKQYTLDKFDREISKFLM
jgi:glycosyltransferase involved in cell wall biosynthesis